MTPEVLKILRDHVEMAKKLNQCPTFTTGSAELLLSAAEENAALKQQLSASEWIRKDNALRTYDGLTEQLAESRARVAELEEALGNILLSHDGRCVLICDDQNPFGKWACVEECADRIVRKARSRSEAKERQ